MPKSLKIPVVLWSETAPSHEITSTCKGKNDTIVSGCFEGQLIFWKIRKNNEEIEVKAKSMLTAHTSSVESIAYVENSKSGFYGIVSLGENQELCLWNSESGCCIISTILQGRFNKICSLEYKNYTHSIVCYGNKNKLYVIDPFNMKNIMILSEICLRSSISTIKHISYINSDKDDILLILLGITYNGLMVSWRLPSKYNLDDCPLKIVGKFESLPNNIVESGIKMICTYCYDGNNEIILWSKNKVFYTKYPELLCLQELKFDKEIIENVHFLNSCVIIINFTNSSPKIYKIVQENFEIIFILALGDENFILSNTCVISSWLSSKNKDGSLLYIGSNNGNNLVSYEINIEENNDVKVISKYASSLKSLWQDTQPQNICKNLSKSLSIEESSFLCSLQLQEYGFMIFGLKNGSIIIANTLDLLCNIIREDEKVEKVSNLILTGHDGSVTCLCHPYEECNKHDSRHLLSGGTDFSIRLWNIVSGTQLKVYYPHGGIVEEIFVISYSESSSNSGTVVSMNNTIISVASDHSVAIINLAHDKEIMVARCHSSPVTAVKVRKKEDLLLVYCTDGNLYIWHVSTGDLERKVNGKLAVEIFDVNDEDDNVKDAKSSPVIANTEHEKPSHHFKLRRGFHFHIGAHDRNNTYKKNKFQRFFEKVSIKHKKLGESNKKIASESENKSSSPPNVQFTSFQGLSTLGSSHASSLHSFVPTFHNNMHNTNIQHFSEDGSKLLLNTFVPPYDILSIRTGHHDNDFYIFFFDIDILITQLLSEEQRQIMRNYMKNCDKIKSNLDLVSTNIQSTTSTHGNIPVQSVIGSSQQNLSLIILTLGLCPTSDSRTYHKYCLSVQNYHSYVLLNTAKFILSCLHPWEIDLQIDNICLNDLELPYPIHKPSYGLLLHNKMQITLPYISHNKNISHHNHIDHWQISSLMTTHHIISLLALSETFIHLYSPSDNNTDEDECEKRYFRHLQCIIPVEAPNGRQFITSSVPDLHTNKSNEYYPAYKMDCWKIVHRNHTSITSQIMSKNLFCFSPSIAVLIYYWLYACIEIRDGSYCNLLSELIGLHHEGRQYLVSKFSSYIPSPEIIESTPIEELLNLPIDDSVEIFFTSNTRSQKEYRSIVQCIGIFLICFIVTEFPNEFDPLIQAPNKCSDSITVPIIINLACIMSKTLNLPINLKKQTLFAQRRAFVFMLGKSFSLWQPHLNLSIIIMSLLDSVAIINFYMQYLDSSKSKMISNYIYVDLLYSYRMCLREIMLTNPQVLVTFINKEITRHYNTSSYFSVGQSAIAAAAIYSSNVRHQNNPLSTHPNVLQLARCEIYNLINLMAVRIPNSFVEQIIEVIDLLLNCSAYKLIKKDTDIFEAFPFLKQFNIIDYCLISRRLAVGTVRGQFGIYDIRNLRCNLTSTFNSSVTCLKFSPDGRYLALYSYDEMKLCLWSTHQSILGIINNNPRLAVTFHLKEQSILNPSQLHQVRIIWDSSVSFSLVFSQNTSLKFTI